MGFFNKLFGSGKENKGNHHIKKYHGKSKIVTIFSIFLFVYGALGIIGSAYGFFYVANWGIPTQMIGGNVTSEFQDMSTYMSDASSAATNAAGSIRSAKNTLYSAANAARSASSAADSAGDAIYKVASFVSFKVLGWQPFAETYDLFQNTGEELKETSSSLVDLSSNIRQTGNNLEQNAKDMEGMSDNLKEVSRKLDSVSSKIGGNVIPTKINSTAYIMLGFLAFHFVLLIFLGACLLKLNKP